jgi:predicted helicase
VIVPTLDLVRQTMKTFAGQMKTPLPYVSVCSENDIDTTNEDGVRIRTFDVPGLVTTAARALSAFRDHFNEFLVFSTYQSLHAVIEAGMEFDLIRSRRTVSQNSG